jgi:hypothetical protein
VSLNPELERKWRDIGSVTPPHGSLLPSMSPSSPIREAVVPSVTVSLRQDKGVWTGIMNINGVHYGVSSATGVTAYYSAADEKTQLYISVRPTISTVPQRRVGDKVPGETPDC